MFLGAQQGSNALNPEGRSSLSCGQEQMFISRCRRNQEGNDCHEQIIKRLGEGNAETNEA